MMPITAADCLSKFNYDLEEYKKFQETNKFVRNMIINAVDDKYIFHLKKERTIYQSVETIDMLDHFWTTYGTVEDGEITEN